jgi:hypothetical protein
MGITFEIDIAHLTGTVSVEDAEGLLEWLRTHPRGAVDLSACDHLHTANLQVLMAARPRIAAWPVAGGSARWLKDILDSSQGD